MKINFNQELKTLNGENIKGEDGKNVTLKNIAVNSLFAVFVDEQNLQGIEKEKRGLLAERIYLNPKEIDLTVEEISLIKQLVGRAYGSLIVFQSYRMLEKK